jgi:photosystem II stability/assembly factor-like uncharacterized protein
MLSIRSIALATVITAPVLGQAPIPSTATSANSDTAAPAGGPFDRLHFRSIGPAVTSGRIDDFAVLERDPRIFYIATATGGLWKTTNNGVTLTPVFDSASLASIGAVRIPADDPNLVWVGTGENNNRQSSSWGDGVYKSTDGGKSWKQMGLRDSKQIARIVIDPVDHDVVYVAALGDLWKSGGERGIYKTSDGGLTWTKMLDAGPDAGGPNSGIWKSTDAGRSWIHLTKGLPAGPIGRIGLDIFRKNPSIVYARIEHAKEGGVYRSDDAGANWTRMGSTNDRPMYFGIIKVDPANDLRVYEPVTPMLVSDDGGKTFRSDGAPTIHVDFHAMWIDPNNGDHMMIGGDGGVGITYDKGKKWLWLPHLPVGQFYHVGYDMEDPYNICGGLQDNNSWCGPSATRAAYGIGNDAWLTVVGGDGFVSLIDPASHRIIFSESQDGFMGRIDKITNESKSIRPEAPLAEKPYRWNWDTPMMLSHADTATVYVGANKLLKSVDRGQTWTAISPDLTTGVDRDTLELMGIKGKDIKVAKNDGVDSYAALYTIAESWRTPRILWTGSDDGLVHVSRDGGTTWANVTAKIPGAPKLAYVSKVEPSRYADGTAYVSFDSHRTGDYGTYLFVTTDFGASFRSIAANLPKGEVVRTITEDQKNADVIYIGTETGLWVSTDRGRDWVKVRANLPTVPVYEITQHPRDNAMILATHGRAIWILDDMTPFQSWAKSQASDFVFASKVATLTLPMTDQERSYQGDMIFLGENPPLAAFITYAVKSKPDSVRIVIKDATGAVVRELKGDTAKAARPAAGLNIASWDLRVEPLAAVKGGRGEIGGPLVLPGTYVATVFVNGKSIGNTPVPVRADPESQISVAGRKANFDILKELQILGGRLTAAVVSVQQVDTQLTAIKKALGDSTKIPAGIRATMDTLTRMLTPLRRKFGIVDEGEEYEYTPETARQIVPSKLGGVAGNLGGFLAGPSATDLRALGEVRTEAPAAIAETNVLVTRFAGFVKELAAAGLYPVVPAAVP